jgi:hypothetical protein
MGLVITKRIGERVLIPGVGSFFVSEIRSRRAVRLCFDFEQHVQVGKNTKAQDDADHAEQLRRVTQKQIDREMDGY